MVNVRCFLLSVFFSCPLLLGTKALADTNLLSQSIKIKSTGADNSLEKAKKLFSLKRLRNGEAILSTKSELINIHSHFDFPGSSKLKNYTYTGEFKVAEEFGGVGVTFHSDYPNSDTYYRLRRYSNLPFHIAPHGTDITDGTTDSGVVPTPKRWYKFKIAVKTLKTRTNIKAKVWLANRKEPRGWQIDCSDASDSRIRAGKPGVWSMADGLKSWRDLEIDN